MSQYVLFPYNEVAGGARDQGFNAVARRPRQRARNVMRFTKPTWVMHRGTTGLIILGIY